MKKKEKTNVMRVLDSKKIKYNEYYYGDTEAVSGVDVAKALGQNPENVFKTFVEKADLITVTAKLLGEKMQRNLTLKKPQRQ